MIARIEFQEIYEEMWVFALEEFEFNLTEVVGKVKVSDRDFDNAPFEEDNDP